MLFSYLDLPSLPTEFIDQCKKNIDLIDNNDFLNLKNKKEGIGHSITFIPSHVSKWLKQNCTGPLFKEEIPYEARSFMLHVSHYIKHEEGNGTHPIHFDYGREYAINYIIDKGGDQVITSWYKNDRKTVIEELEIEPFRWHIIRVKPALHGVRGIQLGRLRCVVSTNFNIPDDKFDFKSYFGDKLIEK